MCKCSKRITHHNVCFPRGHFGKKFFVFVYLQDVVQIISYIFEKYLEDQRGDNAMRTRFVLWQGALRNEHGPCY
jgi:hypothetical protein